MPEFIEVTSVPHPRAARQRPPRTVSVAWRAIAMVEPVIDEDGTIIGADVISTSGQRVYVAEAREEVMARVAEANTDQQEILRLREDCQQAYVATATLAERAGFLALDQTGALLAPIDKLLDNLLAAAEGKPRPHAELLPFVLDMAATPAGSSQTASPSTAQRVYPVLLRTVENGS